MLLCSNLALGTSCHHRRNARSQSFLVENVSLEHEDRNVEFLLQSISNAIKYDIISTVCGLCKQMFDMYFFHSAAVH